LAGGEAFLAVSHGSYGRISMAEKLPMSPPSARVKISHNKEITIVEFVENKILDEMNITEIGQVLTNLAEERDRPKLLLDFFHVEHLSSAALGMLINVNNKIKQNNGQLRLASIRPQIMEVFVITKLNRLFRISATREDALGTFE
jgi:anti-sigma B factor antagonist